MNIFTLIGRRTCTLGKKVGEFYTSSNTQHAKNENKYATTWLDFVLTSDQWKKGYQDEKVHSICYCFPSFETKKPMTNFENM
jgi:hypothetical protein